MNYCIPIPCFFPNTDFSEAIRTVGKLGFSYAETYKWQTLDFESVNRATKESGVKLLSMCTSEFDMTNPEKRKIWISGLRESCEAAKKIGVEKLITQVGNDTGALRAYQHESIVKACTQAKSILEYFGITLMIEPLNTLVDHKGYYLWQAAEGFEIVKEVNSPFVKIVYDIYHQQIMEGNIIPNITNNLEYIAHLHAAGHPGRHELQYGESDYKNIFAAVEKAGYTGAVGLEYHPLLEPCESLKVFKQIYMN